MAGDSEGPGPGGAAPEPRALLRAMFDAAVAAASPLLCAPPALPGRPRGRTLVIGAGKASAAMARAVEAAWDGPLAGLVVTRDGHAAPCRHVEIVEAAHPGPDGRGTDAVRRMPDPVAGVGPDDLVIARSPAGARRGSACRPG